MLSTGKTKNKDCIVNPTGVSHPTERSANMQGYPCQEWPPATNWSRSDLEVLGNRGLEESPFFKKRLPPRFHFRRNHSGHGNAWAASYWAAIVLTVVLLTAPETGWAYVDPGITGMIYQIGFLLLVSISTVLAVFGRKISAWARRLASWRVKNHRDH